MYITYIYVIYDLKNINIHKLSRGVINMCVYI